MKKKVFLSVIILGALLCHTETIDAQEKSPQQADSIRYEKDDIPYLYVGGGYETLFMFGDVYSVTESRFQPGHKFNLMGGYKFSPIFGLEFKFGIGRMIGNSRNSSNQFILGSDGMTYYPYTLVDGQEYTPNYIPNGYKQFFGNWDDIKVKMAGTKYEDLQVSSMYYQMGMFGVFNLNRLFLNVPEKKEQLLTLLLKPGIYLHKFNAQAYTRKDKKNIAPRIASKLSLGLGGDVALHIALNKHVGIELSSGLIWVSDQGFDGIRTIRQAKDDYLVHAGLSLILKFPTKDSPIIIERPQKVKVVEEPVPVTVEEPAPVVSYEGFAYNLPDLDLSKRKERSITEKAMIHFNVAKTDLIPSLGTNQLYLNKIKDLFLQLKSDKDISIEKIKVSGYASPEGRTDFNQMLSNGRAQSIANYITLNYDISSNMITSEGKGEDWQGLINELKSWSNPQAYRLLTIASSDALPNTKKTQLKQLGNVYIQALKELYPKLRRNEVTFQFVVRPFTLEEVPRLLHTNPEKLSAEEILSVAKSYAAFSQLFNDAVNVAVKYYPDVEVVKVYKATTLLKQEKSKEAKRYLDSCKDKTAIIENLYGVVYLMQGDKVAAKAAFERAITLGSDSAKQNLQMFLKK